MVANEVTEEDFELAELPQALTEREYNLIQHLNLVATWLARESEPEVRRRCQDELDMTEKSAQLWIDKAKNYMALGAVENVEAAKAQYHLRLLGIYHLCMRHAEKDVVEVTTKPMKVVVEANDGTPDGMTVIDAKITKVKPNCLDVGAVGAALKCAREMAHISGARPTVAKGARIGNMNVLMNGGGQLPTAPITDGLANADLAALVGAEVMDAEFVEVSPDGEAPAGADGPNGTLEGDSSAG